MMRSYGLAVAAVAGLVAMAAVILADHPPAAQAAPAPVAAAPFRDFVAGAGVVEPFDGSIAIGAPVSGIVAAIAVRPGDKVRTGAILFRLDDADLQSQRPGAVAAVGEAKARLAQADALYRLVMNIPDRRAVSEEEIVTRRAAVRIAEAALAASQARFRQLELEAARRTVRAPVGGTVLQVAVRPGESVQAGAARAPMLMAAGERLVLRVDIDEFEAGRITAGARAAAFTRGSPATRLPLAFERIEPVMVAKTALTGAGTERVDSRVLQLIYSLAPGAPAIYVGQQMDVYVEVGGAEPAR